MGYYYQIVGKDAFVCCKGQQSTDRCRLLYQRKAPRSLGFCSNPDRYAHEWCDAEDEHGRHLIVCLIHHPLSTQCPRHALLSWLAHDMSSWKCSNIGALPVRARAFLCTMSRDGRGLSWKRYTGYLLALQFLLRRQFLHSPARLTTRLDLLPTEICPSSSGSSVSRRTLYTVPVLNLGISVHIA